MKSIVLFVWQSRAENLFEFRVQSWCSRYIGAARFPSLDKILALLKSDAKKCFITQFLPQKCLTAKSRQLLCWKLNISLSSKPTFKEISQNIIQCLTFTYWHRKHAFWRRSKQVWIRMDLLVSSWEKVNNNSKTGRSNLIWTTPKSMFTVSITWKQWKCYSIDWFVHNVDCIKYDFQISDKSC